MRFTAHVISAAIGLTTALMLSFGAGPAHGAMLNGDFTVVGVGDTEGVSFATATKLDFGNFWSGTGNGFGNAGTFLVTTAEGDLEPLFLDIGTIKDLSINPVSVPITAFLSVSGFTFDLLTLNVVSQTIDNIVLAGTGLMKWAGFDNTPGIFTLSSDSGSTRFAFSAGAHSVPAPGTLGLVALGLLGLGLAMRRKKQLS
jgi:hypothetical protein